MNFIVCYGFQRSMTQIHPRMSVHISIPHQTLLIYVTTPKLGWSVTALSSQTPCDMQAEGGGTWVTEALQDPSN